MSLVLRLRRCLPNGLRRQSFESHHVSLNSSGFSRYFGHPARKEEEEEDEVEVDQRMLPADYDPSNFDPSELRDPPTERVWRLVDEVTALTLAETAELSQIMMKKVGMKEMPTMGVMKPGAAGMVMNAAPGGAAAKEEAKPEKTIFELKLESFEASSKIKVIKEVRALTDLGLKEAKDLVEKSPAVLKTGVTKEEAEKIIEKMKTLGAKVVME